MSNLYLKSLFGCFHRKTTFPMRPPSRDAVSSVDARRSNYVVCLDCGKEFEYDWNAMRIGASRAPKPLPAAHRPSSAANPPPDGIIPYNLTTAR